MMSTRPKTYGTFCAAMLLQVALAGASAASETAIENQIDTVNKHFEVASEYFGDGTVQLHSKREGADGTFHSVHQFDCVNKNYDTLYDGDFTPDAFPMGARTALTNPIEQNSTAASLAQHACAKHGHPLLEW